MTPSVARVFDKKLKIDENPISGFWKPLGNGTKNRLKIFVISIDDHNLDAYESISTKFEHQVFQEKTFGGKLPSSVFVRKTH